MFAALAAFLPKKTVVDIFGEDLHAKWELLPIYSRLLGLQGFKPFECVGEPDEMIVAMNRAYTGGEYKDEAAMLLFENKIVPKTKSFEALESKVLATSMPEFLPKEFESATRAKHH
jgi:hypothetical protein